MLIGVQGQQVAANLGAGGTVKGDLIIEGDFKVEGGGSFAYDEIIEGTLNVDGEIQQTKIRIYNSSNQGFIDHSGAFGGGTFFIILIYPPLNLLLFAFPC
jgi:hypothetical protein